MAKDNRKRPKRNGKQSAATHRAQHRKHSAASDKRKREAGLIRVSVWVQCSKTEDLRQFARKLNEDHRPENIESVQASDRKNLRIGLVTPQSRKKRKNRPCDARQLDLFGPG